MDMYKLLSNNSSVGFWDHDILQGKVYLNTAFKAMLGYGDSELENTVGVWQKLIFTADVPLLLNDAGDIAGVVRFYHKNGSIVFCEYSVHVADRDAVNNNPVKVMGTLVNITEVKLAEEKAAHTKKQLDNALQISEQRFKTAFDYSPIGMALVSLSGTWLRVNQNICDLLGYTARELMDKTFQEITYPDDINSDLKLLKEVLDNQLDSYQLEKRYICKNGNIVWALLNVSLVRQPNGEPLHFVSQIINITSRKQIELALKESEVKYRKIFDNVQDVFYQTDINGIITEVSPSIEKYSGYKREQIIGTNVDGFYYYPADKQTLVNRLMEFGKVTDYHVRLKAINNEAVYASVNAHVIRDRTGFIQGFEGSMRDINERKKAEDALVERDARFTKLTDQIPGTMYQFQYYPDGRYHLPFSSKGMANLFELDSELIKNDATLLLKKIYKPDIKNFVKSVRQSFHNLSHWDYEFRVNLPIKGLRWLKGQSVPELLDDKSVLWHGYLNDITEQKDRQQELQATFDIVSEQNNRLINFAYIISHNLRTHSGNFEMLVNLIFDTSDEDEKLELLQHLKKVSSQLSETIMHLNDVVSIQTTISQERSKVNLYDYVEKTKDILAVNTGIKKVVIDNQVAPQLELDYNPAYIESILFNFLSNGIKYKHPDREANIIVKAYTENHKLVLSIEDNGLGIDLEKHADKLFGMYRTFHDNSDAKGIGLFITKNQVEAMGGRIEVSSRVNLGTVFKIYLL